MGFARFACPGKAAGVKSREKNGFRRRGSSTGACERRESPGLRGGRCGVCARREGTAGRKRPIDRTRFAFPCAENGEKRARPLCGQTNGAGRRGARCPPGAVGGRTAAGYRKSAALVQCGPDAGRRSLRRALARRADAHAAAKRRAGPRRPPMRALIRRQNLGFKRPFPKGEGPFFRAFSTVFFRVAAAEIGNRAGDGSRTGASGGGIVAFKPLRIAGRRSASGRRSCLCRRPCLCRRSASRPRHFRRLRRKRRAAWAPHSRFRPRRR